MNVVKSTVWHLEGELGEERIVATLFCSNNSKKQTSHFEMFDFLTVQNIAKLQLSMQIRGVIGLLGRTVAHKCLTQTFKLQ